LEELLASVLETGKPRHGRRLPARLDRGQGIESVHLEFVYSPLRATSGRVEGIAVTAFEVTERAAVTEETASTR
jgi:hypothetical protein